MSAHTHTHMPTLFDQNQKWRKPISVWEEGQILNRCDEHMLLLYMDWMIRWQSQFCGLCVPVGRRVSAHHQVAERGGTQHTLIVRTIGHVRAESGSYGASADVGALFPSQARDTNSVFICFCLRRQRASGNLHAYVPACVCPIATGYQLGI